MTRRGWIAGVAVGVLATATALVAPALQAQINPISGGRADFRSVASGFGGFTPASADPKLAAVLARDGLTTGGFRFTPAESRGGNRSVTVAVRARTGRTQDVAAIIPPAVTMAPIAYNLGTSVGWKRFALGEMPKVDLGTQSNGHAAVDLGVTYTGKKFGNGIKAGAVKPLAGSGPRLLDDEKALVDVGGAYSVTRNLDVIGGVRYKNDEQRLPRLNDNRRDNQAVYVGTAFRF